MLEDYSIKVVAQDLLFAKIRNADSVASTLQSWVNSKVLDSEWACTRKPFVQLCLSFVRVESYQRFISNKAISSRLELLVDKEICLYAESNKIIVLIAVSHKDINAILEGRVVIEKYMKEKISYTLKYVSENYGIPKMSAQ